MSHFAVSIFRNIPAVLPAEATPFAVEQNLQISA
jgi:hypothetical protein